MNSRRFLTKALMQLGSLSVLLLVCILFALKVGAVDITPDDIFRELASRMRGTPGPSADVLWSLRIPRVLLAAVVGAVLAAGGAALQGLLGNPLAEPYTAGVSSGCLLGVSLAIVFPAFFFPGFKGQVPGWGPMAAAFVTGLIAVSLVLLLARRTGKLDVSSFLLAGIIVGSFFWAVTTFLLTATNQDLARILRWLIGSLATPYPWDHLVICSWFALVTLAGLLWFSRDLNAFAMGEDSARTLGVEPERLKLAVIGFVTLGTAACVSVAGVIGFVGLIVPHGVRKLVGYDHRLLIPASALGGACLLVLADALARGLVPPREIPIGVITSAIGAPVFLFILTRGKK
mgnify:CR=1 FL=1